ncbi:AraC family transcriptional regulator [Mycolicibacterium austroafricanum]|uniref:AraC family transcriptional regulator n=1 Tax=Mycolicibacterium austroafricanum TaxID=39687 RepID=UPI001CA35432|nr:AraC family transcriptional regulator [Mycolicibacterium austroafricanum]QZT62343.1 AraC family transcriptional regulator [Mycolicibacterium austroafricanum]
MHLIRGSSLIGFPQLVTAYGGDPDAALELANLDPADLGQHDRFIPLRNAIAAVEDAATVLNVADFGRQLAVRQNIDILGPVGVAARTAATVADAFTILDTYMSAYSPGIATRISNHPDPDLSCFEFDFLLSPAPPQAQATELALGVTLRVLHLFLGSTYRPVAVHLPHPPLGTRTDYRRYFGCSPHFNEPTAGFTMRAADLQQSLSHDPLAHQLALNYLSTRLRNPTRDLSCTLRSLIRQLLPTGNLTADVAARQFGLHPKTLQRRLAAEGTTFAQLVDQSRRDTAHRLLRDTDLSLHQICNQLGYSEQSVLTRSCKRWFNTTPTAYRSTKINPSHPADGHEPRSTP